MPTHEYVASQLPPHHFGVDRSDSRECRRLRQLHRRTPEDMAEIARLPGRWAWLSIEAGYEPIDRGRWVLCLLALGEHPDLPMSDLAGRSLPRNR